MKIPPQPIACELCQRDIELLTKHHAIPRTLHSNKRVRKQFSKETCIMNVFWLCRPCHSAIHKALTEKQMAHEYYTLAKLLSMPEIAQFVAWIKTKPTEFKAKF